MAFSPEEPVLTEKKPPDVETCPGFLLVVSNSRACPYDKSFGSIQQIGLMASTSKSVFVEPS